MAAVFDYAAIYRITAECVTPFRTGCHQNDPEAILEREDHRFMIQGSSLAGAFRSWLMSREGGQEMADRLLGASTVNGHLIISDGIFEENTQTSLRPRVRIDRDTGTAADGCKFDTRQICTGSVFQFTITWMGLSQDTQQLSWVEQILGALHEGDITLGGQKSNGFGRMRLEIRKQCFDMTNEKDRRQWILEEDHSTPLMPPKVPSPESAVFRLYGSAPRILVKSGSSSYKTEQKGEKELSHSIIGNLTENGKPVIPGSAIKGAILGRVRSIAEYLQIPQEILDQAFGRMNGENDNGKAGCFHFFDAIPQGKSQPITRIRIDRFTGGVISGGLFQSAPTSGDITLELKGPSCQKAACGLLLFALRDLGLGLYNLGSGYGIGYGILNVNKITADVGSQHLELQFGKDGSLTLEDPCHLADIWQKAMGGAEE